MCSIKKIQITAKIDTAIFNRLNYIIEIIWIEISAKKVYIKVNGLLL